MCVTFCLYVWTCTTCMQHLQRPEEGNRFSESGVKNGCEQPCRCWEPQQKQQGSLTVELSLQLWILTSYSPCWPHVANGNIKLPALRLQTLTTRPDLWADWQFCYERRTLLLSDVYLASHHVRFECLLKAAYPQTAPWCHLSNRTLTGEQTDGLYGSVFLSIESTDPNDLWLDLWGGFPTLILVNGCRFLSSAT